MQLNIMHNVLQVGAELLKKIKQSFAQPTLFKDNQGLWLYKEKLKNSAADFVNPSIYNMIANTLLVFTNNKVKHFKMLNT
ncbi:MAG: hypothetical protein Q7W45_15470 [Bacteroidota bacterium]|nr:hypothetical protein [Bacteroidota bacterium]MDP3145586.1 hypothetical protein [Bacteroidota bacterium]